MARAVAPDMATSDTADGLDRQTVFESLFDALCDRRDGVHQREMAAAALRHETGLRELVGLVDGAERAVYYCGASRTVVAIPLDADGLATDESTLRWRFVGDAASWVDASRDELDWRHPRYDWLGDAGDAWRYRGP